MLGYLLSKIRTDRKMSKTRLSELTNINIGHLSHIEKGKEFQVISFKGKFQLLIFLTKFNA